MNPILPEGTETLVMCSSKSRSGRIKEMIDSFYATRKGRTELVIYVSDDDPHLPRYKEIFSETNVNHIIGPNRNMIQVFNYLSREAYPEYKYYADVADDHVYMTEGWDLKLNAAVDARNGWAIAYGVTRNLPTAIMIGSKIVNTLGYYLPPMFTHTFVDDVIVDIGKALNLLVYLPDVNIDHRHRNYGYPGDATYDNVDRDMGRSGGIYNQWRITHRDEDIAKIRRAMELDHA